MMTNDNRGTPEQVPTSAKGGLWGRRIVFLGGTSGIGLAAARLASRYGAEPVLVGRNPETLESARRELGAERTASFDVTDEADLEAFFVEVGEMDHVLVTTGGPHYGTLARMDLAGARHTFDERVSTMLYVARHAGHRIAPGESLTFMGGTGSRRPVPGLAATGGDERRRRDPGARARGRGRPGASEPYSGRVRGHADVREDLRRRGGPGGPARRAEANASHPPRRAARGRSLGGAPLDDQYRDHQGNTGPRWWPEPGLKKMSRMARNGATAGLAPARLKNLQQTEATVLEVKRLGSE
jgi:NAD(P)-dependent dehydrogenase (short-subunit alcohol dehydrogenase family)